MPEGSEVHLVVSLWPRGSLRTPMMVFAPQAHLGLALTEHLAGSGRLAQGPLCRGCPLRP